MIIAQCVNQVCCGLGNGITSGVVSELSLYPTSRGNEEWGFYRNKSYQYSYKVQELSKMNAPGWRVEV